MSLNASEDWVCYDATMKELAAGNGLDSVKEHLAEDECRFVLFRFVAENVGNAGKGIITEANIVLQWKGPNCSGMKKVKANGALQSAIDKCPANKGVIEVLGLKNLNLKTVIDRWSPGSGSKCIDD